MLHLIELLKACLLMKDILQSQQPCIEFTVRLKEGELCLHEELTCSERSSIFGTDLGCGLSFFSLEAFCSSVSYAGPMQGTARLGSCKGLSYLGHNMQRSQLVRSLKKACNRRGKESELSVTLRSSWAGRSLLLLERPL